MADDVEAQQAHLRGQESAANGMQNASRRKMLTLEDLARSSYHLLEPQPPKLCGAVGAALQHFYEHLREVVVLGNLEACVVRNVTLAAQDNLASAVSGNEGVTRDDNTPRDSWQIDLDKILRSHAIDTGCVSGTSCRELLPSSEAILSLPLLTSLLSNRDPTTARVDARRVRELLQAAAAAAHTALVTATGLEAALGPETPSWTHIALAFTAFSADVLPSSRSGSQLGPRLPDEYCQDDPPLPEDLGRPEAPGHLASLAVQLLDRLHSARPDYAEATLLRLLQAGCQTGNAELVEALLPIYAGSTAPGGTAVPAELAGSLSGDKVLERLASAWAGYTAGQGLRDGDDYGPAQVDDWLDFKHARNRGVRIAWAVVSFALWRTPRPSTTIPAAAWQQSDSLELLVKALKGRPAACDPLARALKGISECFSKYFTDDEADTTRRPGLFAEDATKQAYKAAAGDLAAKMCVASLAARNLELIEGTVKTVKELPDMAPFLDLKLLCLLARDYPHHAVTLLGEIKLKRIEASKFDNVLPVTMNLGGCAVAVSRHDQGPFGVKTGESAGGRSLSTKDADYFSQQKRPDYIVESVLLKRAGAWFGFFFLFNPFFREANNRTVQLLWRVWLHALFAFIVQGPGSFLTGVAGSAVLLVGAIATRVVVGTVTYLLGFVYLLWRALCWVCGPLWRTIRAKTSSRVASAEDDVGGSGGKRQQLAFWRNLNTPHYALLNALVGWGKTTQAVTCAKVPFSIDFSKDHDTKLLQSLLRVRTLDVRVFGSSVVKALIHHKWHRFTKYVVILQLLLHLAYMGVFLVYAWSIKDVVGVDGRGGAPRDHGHLWGAEGSHSCMLPAPDRWQFAYLIALGTITVDFAINELRQLLHFGSEYFRHAWDWLDLSSVILMILIISAHFVCTLGPIYITPAALRSMAAVQVLLLFLRLVCYGMAFGRLGSFVSMVIAITRDLGMFAFFLIVAFGGFLFAILVAQGSVADSPGQTQAVAIKLFTIIFGDIDTGFLLNPWQEEIEAAGGSGVQPLNGLVSVFVALFMILVALILLNLLIAIVNELYSKIRETERFESLRNRAELIVSTEALLRVAGPWWLFALFNRDLFPHFTTWVHHGLAAPLDGDESDDDKRRYLYVIRTETPNTGDKDGTEVEDEDGEDGIWTQRLKQIKGFVVEALNKRPGGSAAAGDAAGRVSAAGGAAAVRVSAAGGAAAGGAAAPSLQEIQALLDNMKAQMVAEMNRQTQALLDQLKAEQQASTVDNNGFPLPREPSTGVTPTVPGPSGSQFPPLGRGR